MSRSFTITERPQTPGSGLFFGFAAMAPLALGAIAAFVLPDRWRGLAIAATLLWGGAVLCFLAGVRRGLSFRTPGGETVAEIVSSLVLFAIGLASLALIATPAAPILLLAGYACLGWMDRAAALNADAPLFFARIRPAQAVIAVLSLGVLVWLRGEQGLLF